MEIRCKEVETVSEFIDAVRIRVDVFIIEQGCPPGYEPDELDKEANHYIALVDNNVVGTARVRKEPEGAIKIERMVVKKEYRGRGVGEELTNYLIKTTNKIKHTKIWMQAQSQAKGFYEKLGF